MPQRMKCFAVAVRWTVNSNVFALDEITPE
jgi:hypothetical protein